MRYMFYAIMGYDVKNDAIEKCRGHVHWFNPNNITVVKAGEANKVVKVCFCDSFDMWCDIGEWQSVVEKIHTDATRPTDMRIQEVVVMK